MENLIKKNILIGLDFDGVLHNNKKEHFKFVYNLIDCLEELEKSYNIDIVLTTNWRLSSNKSFFNKLKSLNKYIVGQTPNIEQEKRDIEFTTFKEKYEIEKNKIYDFSFCIDDNKTYFQTESVNLFLVEKTSGFNENYKLTFIDYVKSKLNNASLNKFTIYK